MHWVCEGVVVDWEACSVALAVVVFLWDQRNRRRDRQAAGRLMARLLIPELRRLSGALGELMEAIDTRWPGRPHVGPSSADRDRLIQIAQQLLAPSMGRDLSELASMPAKVSDKITSLLGWVSQVREVPMFDPDVTYRDAILNQPRPREAIRALVEVAQSTSVEAVTLARKVGAPPTLWLRLRWKWDAWRAG